MKIKNLGLAFLFALTFNSLHASDEILPPACPTIQMSGTNVNCYGNSTGSAMVTVTSGTGPYQFNWSGGVPSSTATTSSISSLSAGTYTVNVKDVTTGCVVVGAYVVGQPDPIMVSATITDVDCYGAQTGSINLNVNGGTPDVNSPYYTYSWTGPTPSTAPNLTNAYAGTYNLTVQDNNSCSYSTSYFIDQPIESLQASTVVTHVDCYGNTTGAIDLTAWGGTAPYQYTWNTGSNAQDLVNIGYALTGYSVGILDANGCTLNLNSIMVNQPAAALGGTLLTSDVACYGDATGSLEFQATGGTAGYTFQWSNSSSLFSEPGSVLSNVVADNYDVTVTDANGCQYSTSDVVGQPPLLTSSVTGTNVSCYGGNDGSITLTVGGGVTNYSYSWTTSNGILPPGQDVVQSPSGLTAGTYDVLVTDANGCTTTSSIEITQPGAPIQTIEEVTHILCFGNNTGAIDLTVTGGTQPYSFAWTPIGSSTEDVNNLIAGIYTYEITDANGCIYSDTVLVTQPNQPLTVTNTITNVNCFGESNGIIDLTVSGGTPGYIFEWSNSSYLLSNTNEDLINYPADFYRYQVTDANGCFVFDTLEITEPPLLETDLVGVNILCKGGNNGSIDLTVTGGVMPYAYSWNTGDVTEDVAGLYAGFYQVIVTDDHGCFKTDTITLTEPLDSLEFTYTVEDVLCNDGTDGSIDLNITGGTVPYDYAWSNGDTLSQIENLTSGYYEFLVTDFNGCIISDSIFVDQPDPLTLNEMITVVSCYGFSDGIIDISPTGGTLPYEYTWYNSEYALSAQTEDLVNYPADMYQLEIIDSNDCFYEMFLEITQPEPLMIEYTFNVVSCAGGIDGNIFVDITGGNPTYNTTWSNGATTEDLLNIPADTYELFVVDQKGCTDSIEVDISQPDSVKINFDILEVSCIDQNDGIAYAFPYGGNGGYYYTWSNGETSSVNEDLSNDWYFLTVTDVLGCIGSDSVFITKSLEDCVEPVNTFTPNDDLYNDTWVIDNMYLYPDADLKVFNKWGNLIHEQLGLYEPWDGTVNGVQVPSGTYYYIINLNHPDREVLTGNIIVVR